MNCSPFRLAVLLPLLSSDESSELDEEDAEEQEDRRGAGEELTDEEMEII